MCTRERIIAVDFDGCLCVNAWPEIGEAKQDVIDALLLRQEKGAKVILWTCRVGERLAAAVQWCADHGITFDAVNANLPVNIAAFGNDCRKIYADEYWDDKAVPMISAAEMINSQAGPLSIRGTMTVKHPWFSTTRAVLDYFAECIEHEKKARIVIDYDPQSENTKISYYRQMESQEVAHG